MRGLIIATGHRGDQSLVIIPEHTEILVVEPADEFECAPRLARSLIGPGAEQCRREVAALIAAAAAELAAGCRILMLFDGADAEREVR
ncbi:MAG: hypothetical protein WDN29_14475 [Methylovirgula sp.]